MIPGDTDTPENKNQYGYRMASDYELKMGPEGFEPSTNQL
jgi:hypothetical protein